MNEEFVTLGKRAIASRNWRWMPGMLTIPSDGMVSVLMRLTDKREWPHDIGLRVPDLTDPATLGCLLYLVRESWGMPTGIIVRYSNDNGRWEVSWSGSTHGGICGFGATEAEALVMALESVQ